MPQSHFAPLFYPRLSSRSSLTSFNLLQRGRRARFDEGQGIHIFWICAINCALAFNGFGLRGCVSARGEPTLRMLRARPSATSTWPRRAPIKRGPIWLANRCSQCNIDQYIVIVVNIRFVKEVSPARQRSVMTSPYPAPLICSMREAGDV
jgi:hypothetical protein